MSDVTLLLLVWAVSFFCIGVAVAVPFMAAFERRRRPASPAHPALDPRVIEREKELMALIEAERAVHADVEKQWRVELDAERARAGRFLARARRAERRARDLADVLDFIHNVSGAHLTAELRTARHRRKLGWKRTR